MREPANEAAGSLSWSIRRHRILGECRRQYWFEYVGPTSSEASAQFRERLRNLRELMPLRFLRGALVHDAIAHLVPTLVKGGPVDVEAACADLDLRIADWEAHAAERVADVFNGQSLNIEVQAAMRADARAHLARFCRDLWPAFAKLANMESEKQARFNAGHVPVALQMDLMGRAPEGRLVIAHWATGDDDPRQTGGLQLATYALWARTALGWDIARVEVSLVFLVNGLTLALKVSEPDIKALEGAMREDWRTISAPGPKSSFAPTPAPARCIECSFATVCPEADLSRAKAASPSLNETNAAAPGAAAKRDRIPPPIRSVMSATHGPKVAPGDKAPAMAEQFTAGVALMREGRTEEAQAAFEFVTRASPNQPDGWHNRGVALARLGRFRESLAAFDASIRLQREDSDSWDGRGVALGEIGRHEESLQAHDQAVHISPGRADFWHNRGLAHFALGHHWQAVESFDKAIAIEEKRYDTWHARALAQQKMGRPGDELASVDALVRIDPTSTVAWRWRAELLSKMGRTKEARASRLELYRAGKGDPTLQYEHGVDLAKRAKDDKAVACFREAVRLDPRHRAAWAELGFVLARQGKHAEAFAATEELLRLEPANREASIRRAHLLSELGRTGEALEAANEATRAHPSAYAAWELLADLAKRAERSDLLERALRGALRLNRRDVPTIHDLGVVLGRTGRTREALAAFDDALRLSPNSVEVLYSKGALLEAQGQLKDALRLYREVLRYHPGHKKATARKAEVEGALGIARPPPRPHPKPKTAAEPRGAKSEHKRHHPRTKARHR